MPSVLSPNQNQKEYAPLADETNPPFGNIAPAPTVTRNGTIVYSKRIPSFTSNSSSADSDYLERVGAQLKNDSEETLSPGASSKGKGRAMGERPLPYDSGDIGEARTTSHKGKERVWDVEQGVETMAVEEPGQYPPLNEVEEEERRIQNNLAKFAAKDAARRRAARESRQMQAAPSSPRSSSSTTSYSRRPFSAMSTSSKRTSIMGIVEGFWPGTPKRNDNRENGELPTVHSPNPHAAAYNNPYDPQPAFSPVPRMVVSPTSPERPSPFADPPAPAPVAGTTAQHRPPSMISTSSSGGAGQSPLVSPTDGPGFAYGGPTWRGGQAAHELEEEEGRPQGGDKWWHALCSWGTDLDGGHEGNSRGNQAGRTNPFE